MINKGNIRVRLITPSDAHLMAKWLSDPEVLQYYEGRDRPFTIEKVKQKFIYNNDGIYRCIVEYRGVSIGYIQFYRVENIHFYGLGEEDETKNIYGMDQFIGEPAYWNRGIGTAMIRAVITYLITEKKADKIVLDPHVWNKRAVRSYEKCGFKKVRILPEHELHEGKYRDCWLMEYSADINDQRKNLR